MTNEEAKKLKVGDRVMSEDGMGGTVVKIYVGQGRRILWDDGYGQTLFFSVYSFARVSREVDNTSTQ